MSERRLLGNIKIVVSRRRTIESLALVTIRTVLPTVTIITVIFGVTLTVPMVRAARPIPVTSALAVIVSVTVPTVVLARRIIASAAAGRRRASTPRGASATTSVTVASRFEAPGSRRRSTSPLNLQNVIAPDALVVHLMVGIIGITTVLVLNESEEPGRRRPGCGNIAANQSAVAIRFKVSILQNTL